MRKNNRFSSFVLFLLGVFSMTKIYFLGCLAITEMFTFAAAPFIFLKNFRLLRKDGFLQYIYMVGALFFSMLISSWHNYTALPFIINATALMYASVSYVIVFHFFLRENLTGIRWFFCGVAISSIITIFVLNPTVQLSEEGVGYMGQSSVEDLMAGQLFWVTKIYAFLRIPISGLYLNFPIWFSAIMPIVYVVFVAYNTESGRSASLVALMGVALMVVGRKSRTRMIKISRHIILFGFVGLVIVFCYKLLYSYAAGNGLLGETQRLKYEHQTRKSKSGLSILMTSRVVTFIGATAALENPFWGYGPRAEDRKGFARRFAEKYGDWEDVRVVMIAEKKALQAGTRIKIPTHSHIIGAWVHYGIFGLIFYSWILYLIVRHFSCPKYCAAIPQWYGYFAITLPDYLWGIFFSPFGNRSAFALMITCLFFARAIGNGRMRLPIELEMEARKHES